jgi:RNA polymerase sigma factor (TIGR02999 family)
MVDEPPLGEFLARARDGSAEAAADLFQRLYDELRALAGRVAPTARGTLTPTVIVHETFLKLAGPSGAARVEDRAHFLNLAARAMRQVVANHARDRAAQKRGGGRRRERLTLVLESAPTAGREVDAAALDEALSSLEAIDARQADIAAAKLLGGLSTAEIATLLGVSTRTVELDWRMAKAHLARSLGQREGSP